MFQLFQPSIEQLKQKHDVKGLIKAATNQKDIQIRKEAIKALGEFQCVEAADFFYDAIKDKDISQVAIRALANLGDTRAIEPLIETIKNEDGFYSDKEDSSLLMKFGSQAVEPIIAALNCNKYHPMAVFVGILSRIDDNRVFDAILSVYHWRKWPEGQPDEGTPIEAIAANSLSVLGDKRAVEPLINGLKSKDDYIGRASAQALGVLKDSRSVEPLIAVLESNNLKVVEGAAEALGAIGDVRAIEPLKKHQNQKYVDSYIKRAIQEIENKNAQL